jgi:alkaline phosphatase D
MPVRASALVGGMAGLATGAEMRVYGSRRIGRLASLHVLDARQYRDRQACTRGDKPGASSVDPAQCPQWEDPARRLLGDAQQRWLDARLAEGGTRWTIIGQSTRFGPLDTRPGAGRMFSNDGWDGYAAERRRVLASLQKHRVANPVMLGGDVHQNWVGHILADYDRPDGARLGVEFCGTSITSRTRTADQVAARLAKNPHFTFADGYRRGYGLATFTHDRLEVALRTVDAPERADSGVSTLARFAVEAGRAAVERLA